MPIWNRKKKNEQSGAKSDSLPEIDQMGLDEFFEPDAPALQPPYEASDKSITASGLYPHEILILDQAASLYTDQEEFPAFWRRDYGMLHLPKLLASLVDRGFLTEAPMSATLEAATVPALKNALRQTSKPVGGKKADLIQRLLSEVPEGQLYALFPRRTFSLTHTGTRALDEAMHIAYIHRKPVEGLTIWDIHRQVLEHPDQSYRTLLWTHLEARALAHIQAKDYAAYRACRYRMYQFQMEENQLKRAFPFLAEVIYYDLSGTGGGADTLERYVSEKYFFPYDKSIVKLSAVCIQAMGKLQTDLELSEEMLRTLLIQFFGRLSVPFHLFTIEECAVIVLLELRGDTENLRKVYELAETRFGQRK